MTDEDSEEVETYDVFEGPRIKKGKKINVMGKIAVTADGRGLSIRDRTVIAASVLNAVGVNIEDTNVNVKSAWRAAKKERLRIAEKVKTEFECPEKVSIHWDGKLLKQKGNIKTNRVAIYVSSVDTEKVRNLLSIPETQSGSEEAEGQVVIEAMVSWSIKHQVVNLVFDTTATNSSGEVGACFYLEQRLGTPIL